MSNWYKNLTIYGNLNKLLGLGVILSIPLIFLGVWLYAEYLAARIILWGVLGLLGVGLLAKLVRWTGRSTGIKRLPHWSKQKRYHKKKEDFSQKAPQSPRGRTSNLSWLLSLLTLGLLSVLALYLLTPTKGVLPRLEANYSRLGADSSAQQQEINLISFQVFTDYKEQIRSLQNQIDELERKQLYLPPNTQTADAKSPAEGLGEMRPLSLIEKTKALALAETTSQVKEGTNWQNEGNLPNPGIDFQVTIVAVRMENLQITYYERLDPTNPQTSTQGVNNYFPAVFYTFYNPFKPPIYKYLMVIVDLPTTQVLNVVNNPGDSGAILP